MVARLRGRRLAAAEKRERLRKSRRQWWSDTANDPGVSDLERATIQKAVREAEVRNDAIAKRTAAAEKSTAGVLLGVLLTATVLIETWFLMRRPWSPTRLYDILWIVAGGLYVGCSASIPLALRDFVQWRARHEAPTVSGPVPLTRRIRRIRPTRRWFVVVLALVITALAAVHGRPASVIERDIGIGVTLAVAVTAFLAALIAMSSRLRIRSLPSQVFDRALPELSELIVRTTDLAPAWDRPDVVRYLVHSVESVARTARKPAPWTGRAPLSDPAIRSGLRQPAEDFARILRAHKRPLALARDRSEYDKVTASLTAGLVAMSSQNWGALFANSPAPRKPWLSSYALTHVLPAAVLGAAALVLPWVPPFRHGSLAAGSIRVSLVSFAVLRLVPGPALSDLVDKALGRGFDSTKR